MHTDDIINDVALLLNIPQPSSLNNATPFTDGFRRRVILEIEDSAASALSSLPSSIPLRGKPLPATGLTTHSAKEYRLPLPSDFLRLLSLRMSDWKVEARCLFPADHWLLTLQEAEIDSLAAASDRPLVFLDHTPDGNGLLRIFGSSPGATLLSASYIPRPLINEAGEIAIPPVAYRPFLTEILRRLDA